MVKNNYDLVLDRIAQTAKSNTQLNTEINIHNMIVNVVEYRNTGEMADHTYENILEKKQGVCDGISKFANELFNRTGIESELVTGNLYENGKFKDHHAWNRVKIDDVWYHVDMTLDLNMTADAGHVRFDYFNLSDQEISRDHRAFIKRHKCKDKTGEYYQKNGLYISDISQFDRLLSKAIEEGKNHICCKIPYSYNVDDMVLGLLERIG